MRTPDPTCAPERASGKAGDSPDPGAAAESRKTTRAEADAQRDLLQNYIQLQERYRRCTDALAAAAHDLKTPLAIVSGYIELLQSEKLGALNDRQREVLRDMQSSSVRLKHFIQDFLTFSVLETGEMKVECEVGDINGCLSEVCSFWSPRFQQKAVALYFLPNDKLQRFPFDYPKVQRVLSNLLENAVKYTPGGGTVWLHAEPHMWERRNDQQPVPGHDRRKHSSNVPNSVRVTVADTGPGIAAEYHQEIFDDFFRLPQNGTQSEGMGLGLAIARRLVQAFGGKIWVESESDAGCKFSFLIPLSPSPNSVVKGTGQ